MQTSLLTAGICALGMIALGSTAARGQAYPGKPVRIVTSAAGGGADFTARLIAQGISGPMGQQVVVENRGSPILAGELASKAPADGYTLLVAGGGTWLRPLLAKMPFDPVNDLAPVSMREESERWRLPARGRPR